MDRLKGFTLGYTIEKTHGVIILALLHRERSTQ